MPLKYQQLLNQFAAEAKKYGNSLQPACSAKDLTDLQARVRKELGAEIPPGYAEFLRQHDGLDWDGILLFASKTVPIAGYKDRFIEGLVEANLGYRSAGWKDQYVVVGDDGMDLYVFEPGPKKYSARDRVSLDKNESYPSFEEMLTALLREHL
jgi:hypothetical protein